MENLLSQKDQGVAFDWDGRFEAVPALSKSLGKAKTKLPVRKKRPLCSAPRSLCCPHGHSSTGPDQRLPSAPGPLLHRETAPRAQRCWVRERHGGHTKNGDGNDCKRAA